MGIQKGVMGQCQEKVGIKREMEGVQHSPPYGRLGQGALHPKRLRMAYGSLKDAELLLP